MLDINFIRENPKLVEKSAKDKNVDINVNHILEIDKKHKELLTSVQKLREERNKNIETIKNSLRPLGLKETTGNREITGALKTLLKPELEKKGKILKEKLEKEEHALNAVWNELKEKLYQIPNLPLDTVPIGDLS